MNAPDQVMTPQQVADYLQVASDTVYRYIREGRLVAFRLGRQYRISKKNVDLLLEVTATVGGVKMRAFAADRVREWIEEDQITDSTRRIGEELASALRQG